MLRMQGLLMKVKNQIFIWRQVQTGQTIVSRPGKRIGFRKILASYLKVPSKVKILVKKLILSLQAYERVQTSKTMKMM